MGYEFSHFHATASTIKQNNALVELRNNQCEWCSNQHEIDNMIVKQFRELFTSSGSVGGPILDCIEKKVSQDQNLMLWVPFDATDVKDALFSMHPDKSLGPNSMNLAFYKKIGIFWVRM